jgi:hypothetical protein
LVLGVAGVVGSVAGFAVDGDLASVAGGFGVGVLLALIAYFIGGFAF